MVMEAFEAYAVKHDGKKVVAIETHAQLWGKINKTQPFKCSIEHFSVDSSAIKTRGTVNTKALSLDIKKDIAQAFGENYSHLGTFHTHPWVKNELYGKNSKGEEIRVTTPNMIRKHKLFDFSNGDHLCEIDAPTITVGEKKYSIALVMTIFAAEKANDKRDGPMDIDDRRDVTIGTNTIEFSLGNIKLWLHARVYEHKATDTLTEADKKSWNRYERTEHSHFNENKTTMPIPLDTHLECDVDFFLEGFGRLKMTSRKAEYRTSAIAEKRWFV
jgi:hypothetical protein